MVHGNFFGDAPRHRPAVWHADPDYRGSFTILSSCLVTLFLCTWAAVHLNLPAEHFGPKPKLWSPKRWIPFNILRRFYWLILGMLVPELVLFIALIQQRHARKLTSQMKDVLEAAPPRSSQDIELGPVGRVVQRRRCEWTNVHSFFAVSGGFAIDISHLPESEHYLPGGRRRVILSPEGLLWIARFDSSLVPDISKAEIEDKSKADLIAKGVVCIQALTFVVQCLYRLGDPGLSITLLELNTAVHCLCALFIYVLWWDKPQDVKEPFTITHPSIHPLCALLCCKSRLDEKSKYDFEKLKFDSDVKMALSAAQGVLPKDYDGSDHRVIEILKSLYAEIPQQEETTVGKLKPKERIPGTIIIPGTQKAGSELQEKEKEYYPRDQRRWNLALQGLIQTKHMASSGWDEVADRRLNVGISQTNADKLDVNQFEETAAIEINQSEDEIHDSTQDAKILLWGSFAAGVIYGGLHLLAWNAPFSTRAEQYAWRTSAIALIVSVPVYFIIFRTLNFLWIYTGTFLGAMFPHPERRQRQMREQYAALADMPEFFLKWSWLLNAIPWVVCLLLFCSARLYLTVECFVSLAFAPDSAVKQPSWSDYLIHYR